MFTVHQTALEWSLVPKKVKRSKLGKLEGVPTQALVLSHDSHLRCRLSPWCQLGLVYRVVPFCPESGQDSCWHAKSTQRHLVSTSTRRGTVCRIVLLFGHSFFTHLLSHTVVFETTQLCSITCATSKIPQKIIQTPNYNCWCHKYINLHHSKQFTNLILTFNIYINFTIIKHFSTYS